MNDSIIIFGGDGYIGWPLAVHLASTTSSRVVVADNLVTRRLVQSVGSDSLVPIRSPSERVAAYTRASGRHNMEFVNLDARDPGSVDDLIAKVLPKRVVHLAQQRSAPFSMIDQQHALYTQSNNLATNLNIVFSMVRHVPKAHLLKMGTMGEFGTPNVEIPEGAIVIERKGRKHLAMFPRTGQSWYHLSKVFDTHNVILANKLYGLTATDVMQGVVYGSTVDDIISESLATRFDFDSIWGTIVNKYVVQAIVLNTLLIYGRGKQTRAFLSLHDSVKCLSLLLDNPPADGEYRSVNQVDSTCDTLELAQRVMAMSEEFGYKVALRQVENPRMESEEHFYEVEHKILPSLGFKRTKEMTEVLRELFEVVIAHRETAVRMKHLVHPTVKWSEGKHAVSNLFPLPRDLLERWSTRISELARDSSSSSSSSSSSTPQV